MYLNIWWLICCLPVITAGASTAAMHSVMFRMRADKSCTAGDFFAELKTNFKKPTLIWLLMLAAGLVIAAVYYGIALLEVRAALRTVLLAMFCAMVFLWLFVLIYVFALTACFENSVKNTLLTALVTAFTNLRCTVILLGLTLIPFTAFIVSEYWFIYLGFFWIAVYPGLAFYFKAGYLIKAFDKYIPSEEKENLK